MTGTLQPRHCDPEAWRTWLRDGRRLALRTTLGWGPLWLGWCTVRMACLLAVPDTSLRILMAVLFSAASPLAEQCHHHAIDLAMEGRPGLGAFLSGWRRPWRAFMETGPVHGMLVDMLSTGFAAAFLAWLWLPGDPATSALFAIFTAALPSVSSMSESLCPPLRYHLHASRTLAPAMDKAAWRANPKSDPPLRWRYFVALYGSSMLLAVPHPIVELWSSGVFACACADIYGGGYEVKARVRVPTPPRLRMARASDAMSRRMPFR